MVSRFALPAGHLLISMALACLLAAACHHDRAAPPSAPAPPPVAPSPPPPPACPREGEGITVVDGQLVVPPIAFDLYTGTVVAESLPVVDAVARRLTACADFDVEIQVHTDAFRMSEFNARQSQRVAEVVRDRLVADGIARQRLAACGYGESRLIFTAPGAHNARVEWHRVHAAATFVCPTLPP